MITEPPAYGLWGLVGMYLRLSFVEEREARITFGEAYDRYAARVPAFLPDWRRFSGARGGHRTT
jgi:protein-S-isoprenylcysteine O-methyltransferase Ste14